MVGWLSANERIGVSAVAWGEFLCGPLSHSAEALARQLLPNAEPFDHSDAELAAILFNATGRRSKSYADCCIASVAIRLKVPLAMSNIDDFKPMEAHGLALA